MVEELHQLEREEAPKHLIKAARKAIKTNPTKTPHATDAASPL